LILHAFLPGCRILVAISYPPSSVQFSRRETQVLWPPIAVCGHCTNGRIHANCRAHVHIPHKTQRARSPNLPYLRRVWSLPTTIEVASALRRHSPHNIRESERRSLPLNSQWRKRKTHGSQLQPSKPKMRLASEMANQPSGELAPVRLAPADLLAVEFAPQCLHLFC
jgi:hypothetical protein